MPRDAVLNAWKGGTDPTSDDHGVAAVTAKGYRVVNSNQTAYYVGWASRHNPAYPGPGQPETVGIALEDMYIDIAAGVPEAERTLLLGGEVSGICAFSRSLATAMMAMGSSSV